MIAHNHRRPGGVSVLGRGLSGAAWRYQTPEQVKDEETTMALPTLTPEQRDAALAKARQARQARSNLLADITSGQDTVPAVLARAQSDPVAAKTKVSQLVRAIPGYGLQDQRPARTGSHPRRPTGRGPRWPPTRGTAGRPGGPGSVRQDLAPDCKDHPVGTGKINASDPSWTRTRMAARRPARRGHLHRRRLVRRAIFTRVVWFDGTTGDVRFDGARVEASGSSRLPGRWTKRPRRAPPPASPGRARPSTG